MIVIARRKCTLCGEWKNLSEEYYFRRQEPTKRSRECKRCIDKVWIENGQPIPENPYIPRPEGLPLFHKKCKCCGEVKHKDEFPESRGNRMQYDVGTTCKTCVVKNREETIRRQKEKVEKRRAERRAYIASLDPLVDTKVCSVCQEEKVLNEFIKGKNQIDGRSNRCRSCDAEYRKEYWKNLSPEEKRKTYDRSAQNIQKRYASNLSFKIAKDCRGRIWSVIQKAGVTKTHRTDELIGLTPDKLYSYIMEQGYNRGVDHIDHILPLSRFDLSDERCQLVAFNYRNLQPLNGTENIQKYNKLPPDWESVLIVICSALSEDVEYIKSKMNLSL